MKKTTLLLGIAFLLSATGIIAQTPETQPTTPPTTTTSTPGTYPVVKSDLTSKFIPMPEALTTEKIFPVLGSYQSTQSNIEGAGNISIVLDPENKGTVWIEGLPQGRIKAQLRKSPAVYRIPAQKTEDGKQIAEGTLVFDQEANVLNICMGCNYNAEEPAKPFMVSTETEVVADATVKTKKPKSKNKVAKVKVWNYSGSKIDASTATISNQ